MAAYRPAAVVAASAAAAATRRRRSPPPLGIPSRLLLLRDSYFTKKYTSRIDDVINNNLARARVRAAHFHRLSPTSRETRRFCGFAEYPETFSPLVPARSVVPCRAVSSKLRNPVGTSKISRNNPSNRRWHLHIARVRSALRTSLMTRCFMGRASINSGPMDTAKSIPVENYAIRTHTRAVCASSFTF